MRDANRHAKSASMGSLTSKKMVWILTSKLRSLFCSL